MRLAVPLFETYASPEEWVAILKKHHYGAAYCPIALDASDACIAEYRAAAEENDIVLPEVGAWGCNPLHPDPEVREASLKKTVETLIFADKIGAHCAVNIAGSYGEIWDSPHPMNLSERCFDETVAHVQRILREAAPKHACYTLEMMPYTLPDSAESYLRLMEAVDSPHFKVHLDPVNIVNTAAKCYDTTGLIRHCFSVLGDKILGVHGKDIRIRHELTLHLEEVCPGRGMLDYRTLMTEMEALDPQMPLILEHMPSQALYEEGEAFVRRLAAELKIDLIG